MPSFDNDEALTIESTWSSFIDMCIAAAGLENWLLLMLQSDLAAPAHMCRLTVQALRATRPDMSTSLVFVRVAIGNPNVQAMYRLC
jgi:hypothetical protein